MEGGAPTLELGNLGEMEKPVSELHSKHQPRGQRRRPNRLWAMAIVAAAASFAAPAWSAQVCLEGIAAIVNEDVVLASEVARRFALFEERMRANGQGEMPERDAVLSQILEQLVMENLQLQEAKARGVEIEDEVLTDSVQAYSEQQGLTLDQFREQLAAGGMTYREFRDEVRRELTLQRVQQNVVNRRIYLTEQDVESLIASPFFRDYISDEYRIGHILLQVSQNATPEAALEAARAADDIVRQLREGADFARMAVEHSAASTALEGGDLGWRKASQIPGLFAEEVLALDIGETADPVRAPSGFHIVQLVNQRGASQEREAQTLARHILLKPSTIRSEEETLEAIWDLHARVLAGEDFADLAREHSNDPGSALAGGELGWAPATNYVDRFREVLDSTELGELSDPFETEHGWHILEVQGRREEDMSKEARTDIAARVLHQRRFEEKLQEWQSELRDEAFVKTMGGCGTATASAG